jgi:hypothetical protein
VLGRHKPNQRAEIASFQCCSPFKIGNLVAPSAAKPRARLIAAAGEGIADPYHEQAELPVTRYRRPRDWAGDFDEIGEFGEA